MIRKVLVQGTRLGLLGQGIRGGNGHEVESADALGKGIP
jgi:hypothetical protein